MTAKDKRKALLISLPHELRPIMRRARRELRKPQGSAALRRIVEGQLIQGYRDMAVPVEEAGPPYRLQLSKSVLNQIETLARQQGRGPDYIVIQLIAAAGADMWTQSPQQRVSLSQPKEE
ncbi:MAG: hypothetical protein ACPGNV_13150 [Mangrovicoccus sp.]